MVIEMDDCYRLYENGRRGLAYIIVNQTFEGDFYKDRLGAYKDYQNMKKLFKPLGFKLLTFFNKTAQDIKDILVEASRREDLGDRSCFVCVISSHGEQWTATKVHANKDLLEHVIVGSDGKLVRTNSLVNLFSERNCPKLVNKPKLFILQACRENVYEKNRSKALDDGVEIKVFQKIIDKKKRRKRLSKPDAADARPSYQEDFALSEKMLASHQSETVQGDEDDFISDEDDDELSDEYVTDTTDNESDEEDDCRDKNKVKVTPLANIPEPSEDPPVMQEETQERSGDEEPTLGTTKTESSREADGNVDDADSRNRRDRVITDIKPVIPIVVDNIPCDNDMCVVFASPSGKLAWRSTVQGGWLIANLYNVVKHYIHHKHIDKIDFLSILTEVLHDVAFYWETDTEQELFTGKKMIPVVHHQLSKDLVFKVVKKSGFTGMLKKLFK